MCAPNQLNGQLQAEVNLPPGNTTIAYEAGWTIEEI